MNGWVDEWIKGKNEQLDEWLVVQRYIDIDGGWIYGWVDEWMDGWCFSYGFTAVNRNHDQGNSYKDNT